MNNKKKLFKRAFFVIKLEIHGYGNAEFALCAEDETSSDFSSVFVLFETFIHIIKFVEIFDYISIESSQRELLNLISSPALKIKPWSEHEIINYAITRF